MGVDSEKHPMMAMMKAAQGKTRMHMPGHKGRGMKWLSVAMDMTELKDTDDLFAASSGIDKAQRAMAASASAGATIMLTGGSTSGMIAMLLSAAGPDMVEVLPALVPKAITRLSRELKRPVIAGGMATEPMEVVQALQAGALAVSTSERALWSRPAK